MSPRKWRHLFELGGGFHGRRSVVESPSAEDQNDQQHCLYAICEVIDLAATQLNDADKADVIEKFQHRAQLLQSRQFTFVAPLEEAAVEDGARLRTVEGLLPEQRPRTLRSLVQESQAGGLPRHYLYPVVRQLLQAFLELYEAGISYYGAVQLQDVLCLGQWNKSAPRIALTGAAVRYLSFEGVPRPGDERLREGDQDNDLAHLAQLIAQLTCGPKQTDWRHIRDKRLRRAAEKLVEEHSGEDPPQRLRQALQMLDAPALAIGKLLAGAAVGALLLLVAGFFGGKSTAAGQIEALKNELETAKQEIKTLKGRLSDLEGENKRLEGKIKELKMKVVAKDVQITGLKKRIEILEEIIITTRKGNPEGTFRTIATTQLSVSEAQGVINGQPQAAKKQLTDWFLQFKKTKQYTLTIGLPQVDIQQAKKLKKERDDLWKDFVITIYVDGEEVYQTKCNIWTQKFPKKVTIPWQPGQSIGILLEGDGHLGNPNLFYQVFHGAFAMWLLNYTGTIKASDGIYSLSIRVENCPGPPARPAGWRNLLGEKSKKVNRTLRLFPQVPKGAKDQVKLSLSLDGHEVLSRRWIPGAKNAPKFPLEVKLQQSFLPQEIVLHYVIPGRIYDTKLINKKTWEGDDKKDALAKLMDELAKKKGTIPGSQEGYGVRIEILEQ